MGILNKITGKTSSTEENSDVIADKSENQVAEVKNKEAKTEKKSAKKNKTEDKNPVLGVLIAPVVTEKSALGEQEGKYAFAVELSATKNEIKKAIESRYGIKPIAVNIVSTEGKYKRYGRFWGRRKDKKKAIVTLPKGKTINIYESVK